jgi:hypothetical protein
VPRACATTAVESELPAKITNLIQCQPARFSCCFKSDSNEYTGSGNTDRKTRDPSHFRVLPYIIFHFSSIAVHIDVSIKAHVLNLSSGKYFGLVDTEQSGLEEDTDGKQLVESFEVCLLCHQSDSFLWSRYTM